MPVFEKFGYWHFESFGNNKCCVFLYCPPKKYFTPVFCEKNNGLLQLVIPKRDLPETIPLNYFDSNSSNYYQFEDLYTCRPDLKIFLYVYNKLTASGFSLTKKDAIITLEKADYIKAFLNMSMTSRLIQYFKTKYP